MKAKRVVAAQGGGGVENFERVDRQRLEDREANPGAEQIVRVRRNGEAAALVNDLADFARGRAFQIGNGRADAEEVTFGGGDLLPGHDEEIVDRQAVLAHQAFVEQVGDGVASVVIGDGEAVQAFRARGGDVVLRARDAITRKEGMRVQVDLEGHRREASFGRGKWKASVSRNGRSSAKRSDAASRALSCVRAGSRKAATASHFAIAEFFLFPTYFHEQIEKTRTVSPEMPLRRDDEIEIQFFARVEASAVVTSWATAVALEPWHVWQREVVRERFEYDGAQGIHVAFVRVFRLSMPWILPELPAYGGCRSWVNLPVYRRRR